jgi:hypothetical protein
MLRAPPIPKCYILSMFSPPPYSSLPPAARPPQNAAPTSHLTQITSASTSRKIYLQQCPKACGRW